MNETTAIEREKRAAMIERISADCGIRIPQVQAALELLDAGNTIPFVTRYRKEHTGGLDELQLRAVEEAASRIRQLEERRESMLNSLAERDLLTEEIRKTFLACDTMTALEDLYLPWRPRRKTRAGEARRKGLAPLAGIMLKLARSEAAIHPDFLVIQDDQNELKVHPQVAEWQALSSRNREALLAHAATQFPDLSLEEQLEGASDVLAEWISERAELRALLRGRAEAKLNLSCTLKKDHPEAARFTTYAEHSESVFTMPPHRVLAVNRGENLGCLSVKANWAELGLEADMARHLKLNRGHAFDEEVESCLGDCLKRLLAPALERELRAEATRRAEEHSLVLYGSNLRQLLLQPPLPGRVVMGIDPGYRTGCKVAVVDGTGRYLEGTTIYPHAPRNDQLGSRQSLLRLAQKHGVELVAIGNGTASRETVELVSDWLGENRLSLKFTVVSEAGASVYSASEEAREEFPELDASLRGNISIARRLQDPLAELVKIDPRSLGVGQYQHDVDQRHLGEKLDQVVESCVNSVGVDLNTASASLLRRVSGITRRTSRNIVSHRERIGVFKSRQQLLDVDGIGPAAFLQSAGFLRIRNGEEALDNTGVHPERYEVLATLFKNFSVNPSEPGSLATALRERFPNEASLATFAAEQGLGLPTMKDILAELEKPGRDPREELDAPVLREALPDMSDLQTGMVLEGVVRNVTDFGAFVDLGLKQDGLVHVSQISHQRVNHPLDKLQVGQKVRVQVIQVDLERGRIGLSMKALEEAPRRNRQARPERRDERAPSPTSIAARFHQRGRDRGRGA